MRSGTRLRVIRPPATTRSRDACHRVALTLRQRLWRSRPRRGATDDTFEPVGVRTVCPSLQIRLRCGVYRDERQCARREASGSPLPPSVDPDRSDPLSRRSARYAASFARAWASSNAAPAGLCTAICRQSAARRRQMLTHRSRSCRISLSIPTPLNLSPMIVLSGPPDLRKACSTRQHAFRDRQKDEPCNQQVDCSLWLSRRRLWTVLKSPR